MKRVAIAGGTSKGLGRSLTRAIINLYPSQEWMPVILSRSDTLPTWTSDLSRSAYEFHKVDYASPSSLEHALQGCHTVISVILARDGTQTSSQVALLNAAVAVGCRRFAPSEWACGPAGVGKITLLKDGKPPVWKACEESGLEWARFNVGLFMNYLGVGCSPDPAIEEEALGGCDGQGDMADGSGSFLVSMASGMAEIPMRSDGDFPRVTLTELGNVGEFVAASLALEKWERDMDMVGCTLRLDELVDIAEKITGHPFKVRKLTKQAIESDLENLGAGDFLKQLWLELKLLYTHDEPGEMVLDPVVNRLCPGVRALDVKTYLAKYW